MMRFVLNKSLNKDDFKCELCDVHDVKNISVENGFKFFASYNSDEILSQFGYLDCPFSWTFPNCLTCLRLLTLFEHHLLIKPRSVLIMIVLFLV